VSGVCSLRTPYTPMPVQ